MRLYRFGLEEMLVVSGVALLAFAVVELMASGQASWSGRFTAALAIGAAGGLGLYLRFGFVYAAVAGLACAAAIPFQGDAPAALSRALSAAICAGAFLAARARARQHRDDYQGEDYRVIEAAAWAGVYLAIATEAFPKGKNFV